MKKGRKKLWYLRIEEGIERGEFTQQDKLDAGGWVTCACGEQDPRIPRIGRWNEGYASEVGEYAIGGYHPTDSKLELLGVQFHSAVKSDNFVWAKEVLDKIEVRAGEVLLEVLAQE